MARSARARGKAHPRPEAERPAKSIAGPRRDFWIYGILFLATFAVYFQVGGHDFILYDDPDYVTGNAHVRGGLTLQGIAWAFTSGHAGNWFPLTWVSHMTDCQIFGVASGAHHLINVLFHALAAMLLFAVLNRMTGAVWRSAFVAFLFSLHPLRVESVAWLAERKDVLSAFLWFLTIWAYLGYVQRPGRGRGLLVAAVFSLGLMAKSMVVTLPIVLLLLDVWPLKRIEAGQLVPGWRRRAGAGTGGKTPPGRLLLEKVPLLALSLGVAVITYFAHRGSQAVMSLEMLPLPRRLGNALVSAVAYAGDMLWPARLALLYPFPPKIPLWQPVAAGLALLAVSVLVLRSIRRRPYLAVGWFWYLVTLIPVIGLVQVGSQARADRYTYIPSVGLSIALAWGAAEAAHGRPRLRKAMAAAAVAICLACAALTWRQIGFWQDTISVFRRSLSVTSGNYLAYNIMGMALHDQGRNQEAIANYREALKIDPGFEDAQVNLSQSLLEQGRTAEALAHAAAAARLDPGDEESQYNLGTGLAEQGRFEEAVEALQVAVRLKPDHAEAHFNLGSALASLGRLDEAIAQFNEALRIDPELEGVRENLAAAMDLKRESAGNGKK